jgi:two-component system cell cycle sensor histidine kinase/response regulator CckA
MSTHNAPSIIDALPEPHCVLGRDLTCLDVNGAFAELLNSTVDALRGKSASIFWRDVGSLRWESRECRAEFQLAHGATKVVKLATYAGDVLVIRVLASLSEEQSLQVFHNQRLETLGLLAGGVAHDFNNILTGMLGHVAYLRHILPQQGNHAESIASIEEGALRASSLTQQILKFSKVDSEEATSKVDLADVVTRVLTLLKSAIPSAVEVTLHTSRNPLLVIASEAQLTQVVINLVVNARDAIKGKGAIAISLLERCGDEQTRRLFGDEPPSPAYGALVVKDSGEGMDEEVKSRLFQPYFTTKREQGTGLGLFTVNAIIKQLGGAIEVDSTKGVGTEFRIVLPVVTEEARVESKQERGSAGPAKGNGERVLVVDDEYAVRNVLGLSLSHLGYAVETAASGLEAVEKFSAQGSHFDLVILDLLMPGLSGEEVFMRLRALNPTVRVLIVSGFSSEQVVHRILEVGGRDFIQKPFSIDVLARKVRGCLCD